MKSLKLLLSVIALAVIAAAPVLRAEDAPPSANGAAHKKAPGHGDFLKMLTEQLSLTDDQVAKIKPIMKDEAEALKALRADKSVERKAKREKMMEIRKSHRDQILAILTPEQQAKFKAGQEHHKRGGAPKPTS